VSAGGLALEVRDLSVAYGKVEALHHANLEVPPGSIVTVIGPNGAGKTTMLNALMGLLPARGEVRYEGVSIARTEVEARVAHGLCLVPERRELFAEMSVADNLTLGAFPRHRRREPGIGADLEAVYERFPRLRQRRAQLAGTLSGGERQMLALGRALMAKPRVLMLDEPSLGLAPLVVRDIFRIISDLRRTGVSILLVEQNVMASLKLADRAYVLENGSIVLDGTGHDLLENDGVRQAYLGL